MLNNSTNQVGADININEMNANIDSCLYLFGYNICREMEVSAGLEYLLNLDLLKLEINKS